MDGWKERQRGGHLTASQLQRNTPVRLALWSNLVHTAMSALGAEKAAGTKGQKFSKASCYQQTPESQTPPPKIPSPTSWRTAFQTRV